MIIGIDEVGRGCICGPVVAASVMFPNTAFSQQHRFYDSKSISAEKRTALTLHIKQHCNYGIGWVFPHEIDAMNIHHASLLAMKRSFITMQSHINTYTTNKKSPFYEIIVDGKFIPDIALGHNYSIAALVKGDTLIDEIKAASILAKTTRDNYMQLWDKAYPMYGIAKHKGYPTALHKKCIRIFGIAPFYRKSFKLL